MSAAPTDPIRDAAEAQLRALVGREDARLHEDQWTAIEALVVGRQRALVVQRTGWGKSAVYFVATGLLRAQGAGPTVIVSPLLALMRNQVAAAERAGIHAETINSTNIEQWQEINERIAAGQVDVLLVSPERLNNPGFRDEVLPHLTASAGLVVIDEAHCISDWGHDFRPDYRRIRHLLATLPPRTPVLATTATANHRVTVDVAEQLAVHESVDPDDPVVVLRGALDRESLRLAVVRLKTTDQRLGWLADQLGSLPGTGIIYTLTVAAAAEIAEFLRGRGFPVAAYSGQTEAGERQQLEADLLAGRLKALVATSALGMGFDATLGFVINVGAPASPIAYYQQIGRAGRGIDEAQVVLLPSSEDVQIWRYFASLAFPAQHQVEQVLAALAASPKPMSTPALESIVDLSRGRLEMMLKVLDVDGAVRRVSGGWTATGQPWTYDQERYARVDEARQREQEAMLGYLDTTGCRMQYLRTALDDPAAAPCGRCDNCGGFAPAVEVSAEAQQSAAEQLGRPGVVVDPRRMWPTALANLGVPLSGKITAGAEPGRVVARFTDLGLGSQLRALLGPRAADAEIPAEVPVPVVQAIKATLQDWQPHATAIVAFESTTHGAMLENLVAGLSRFLQLPVLGRIVVTAPEVPPAAGSANSAQRVAAVHRRARLEAGDLTGHRVLLVDDLVATGWSMTLAAVWLRQAGAEAVLPLALASES